MGKCELGRQHVHSTILPSLYDCEKIFGLRNVLHKHVCYKFIGGAL